jgi:hypothetical protein
VKFVETEEVQMKMAGLALFVTVAENLKETGLTTPILMLY